MPLLTPTVRPTRAPSAAPSATPTSLVAPTPSGVSSAMPFETLTTTLSRIPSIAMSTSADLPLAIVTSVPSIAPSYLLSDLSEVPTRSKQSRFPTSGPELIASIISPIKSFILIYQVSILFDIEFHQNSLF